MKSLLLLSSWNVLSPQWYTGGFSKKSIPRKIWDNWPKMIQKFNSDDFRNFLHAVTTMKTINSEKSWFFRRAQSGLKCILLLKFYLLQVLLVLLFFTFNFLYKLISIFNCFLRRRLTNGLANMAPHKRASVDSIDDIDFETDCEIIRGSDDELIDGKAH